METRVASCHVAVLAMVNLAKVVEARARAGSYVEEMSLSKERQLRISTTTSDGSTLRMDNRIRRVQAPSRVVKSTQVR